jgi:hypothetical protein
MARASRLKSSTMLSVRKQRPVTRVSCMKSIDQRSLTRVGKGFGSRGSWATRLRLLRRIESDSSRYSRWTFLWFTRIPSRRNRT